MSKHVLVIQDSRTEALRTRLILEREGYQVALASDGVEGIKLAAQQQPQLILADTLLPQMSGYEACARLKLFPETSRIPILLLSNEPPPADVPGAALDCFMSKPYDPAALLRRVQQLAEASGTGNGNGHGDASPVDVDALQREVQDARQQVQAASRARSEFLANMSHELRTPLHELMGMLDLAVATEGGVEQRGYLETAKTSSNALLTIVSDILEFSEIAGGHFTLEEKTFDPWEPIEKTVEVMSLTAKEKGLVFSSYLGGDVPRTLKGDAKRLRQVLGNLVSNAVKFTEHGEVVVRLTVDKVHDGQVTLHYAVSDTGIGIAADKRTTLFEAFRQAENAPTRRYGGLGLGLAMAQHLVQLMGGCLWVDSEVGKGSTFHFTIVVKQLPSAPAAPKKAEPIPPLKILLAEDSPTNQLIAVSNLKKGGHTVTVAENGRKAVTAFEQSCPNGSGSSFDLVLMDVAMPEMDGLDATRAIREYELEHGGHVTIIAMTAFATKEYQDKCITSGMDAYVTKPIRMDELYRIIGPMFVREPAASPAPAAAPAQAPASTAPAVVLQEAMEVVGGDVDILAMAVAASLEEVPGELEKLKTAVNQRHAKGVEAQAHRLKGIMGNLGGMQARAVGQRLETMGEQGNLAEAPQAVQAFEAEIARVQAFYTDPGWEERARAEQEATNG